MLFFINGGRIIIINRISKIKLDLSLRLVKELCGDLKKWRSFSCGHPLRGKRRQLINIKRSMANILLYIGKISV